MLKNITRDNSYFNTLKLNRSLMKAADFDYEFANIINYINNDLLPVINNFIINIIPGIIGNENFYLKNVGDGTTTWAPIIQWQKYSLDVNQLENLRPMPHLNYILGLSLKYSTMATFEPNEVLQTQAVTLAGVTGLPAWGKIFSSMISDQAITGKHLKDLIPQSYFNSTIRPLQLRPNSISNKHFQNQAITKAKLKSGSIRTPKLNFNGMLDKIFRSKVATDQNYINFVTKCLKSMSSKKLTLSRIEIATSMIFPNNSITSKNFKPNSITREKIALKCLDDSFFAWRDGYNNINPQKTSYIGLLTPKNLIPGFAITGKKFVRHSLRANMFTIEVQKAFALKGIHSDEKYS